MATPIRPKDYRKETCTPISSECVIWDGPDIPCLDLCKGDSIEKVTYDLAIEVCNILDALSLEGVDVSCFFNDSCKPKTFEEFLQFIVDTLCDFKNQVSELRPFTCNSLSSCNIILTDCNRQQVTLPLYGTGTNVFTYLFGKICELQANITNINTQITNINNTINSILNTLNNLTTGSGSFTSLSVTNCIKEGAINNSSELSTYLNVVGIRICTLYNTLFGNPTTSSPITGSWTCIDNSYFNINTSFNNLLGLVSSLNQLINELCQAFGRVEADIQVINENISTLETNIENCQCNCPKTVRVIAKYLPTFNNQTNSYNYNNIQIQVFPPSSWSVSSIQTDATNNNTGLVLVDGVAQISNTIPVNVTNTPTYQFQINGSLFTTGLDSYGCISKSSFMLGNRLVYSRNPYIDISLMIILTSGTTSCTIYKQLTVPMEWCLCGYVENVEFIEYDTYNRLNPSSF